MKDKVVKGTTSYVALIFIQDASSSTGSGLTGLTSGSAGLVCYRARDDDGNAAATAIALSGGTRGTWSSGGFVEKDATNMPGWYEIGIPNAALATGSRKVGIHLKGATNMAPLPMEIMLTGWDDQDAARGGLTSLPNAVPGASGGLLIAGSNAATTFASLTVSGTTTFTGATVHTGAVSYVAGVVISQNVTNLAGLVINGNGIGSAVNILGGATGSGLYILSGASSSVGALHVESQGSGAAIRLYGGPTGSAALRATIQANGAHVFQLDASGSSSGGSALNLVGPTSGGNGLLIDTVSVTGATTLTGAVTASNAANNIVGTQNSILDALTSAHQTAATIGKAISDAGAGGDPWATLQPGSYAAGTFGYLLAHMQAHGDLYWATYVISASSSTPLPATGALLTLNIGDDYTGVNSLAFATTSDMTGKTLQFELFTSSGQSLAIVLNAAITVVSATLVQVALPRTATAALTPANCYYSLSEMDTVTNALVIGPAQLRRARSV